MSSRIGPMWIPLITFTVIVVVAFAAIWGAAPEDLRGWLLLAAGVVSVLVYGAIYTIQRHRHW